MRKYPDELYFMKKCPYCDYWNAAWRKTCGKCGAALK